MTRPKICKYRCIESDKLPQFWEFVQRGFVYPDGLSWDTFGVIIDQRTEQRWLVVIYDYLGRASRSKGTRRSFRLMAEARAFAKRFMRARDKKIDELNWSLR